MQSVRQAGKGIVSHKTIILFVVESRGDAFKRSKAATLSVLYVASGKGEGDKE